MSKARFMEGSHGERFAVCSEEKPICSTCGSFVNYGATVYWCEVGKEFYCSSDACKKKLCRNTWRRLEHSDFICELRKEE